MTASTIPMGHLVYEVDAEDVVTRIDGEWDAFAAQNAARSCLATQVIGRSLWEFVRDPALRAIYEALFASIRGSGGEKSFPFRCDSPHQRRTMRMTVRDLGAGAVRITSALEEVASIAPPLMVVAASSGAELLRRCSICLTFGWRGRWAGLDELLEHEALFDRERPLRVIYAVCEECRHDLARLAASPARRLGEEPVTADRV